MTYSKTIFSQLVNKLRKKYKIAPEPEAVNDNTIVTLLSQQINNRLKRCSKEGSYYNNI